ncbi:MAG: CYTH domain-containing protein [Lachnospiraceae bacterium]|nr:CYTH domain-containing protein [Lachnospiraceae bacterium]
MEIERKFIIKQLPENLADYEMKHIEQAYLNIDPVVRIRKEDTKYYLTYKEKGLLIREEYNLPLDEKSYYHLRLKADGNVISKNRYIIPIPSIDSVGQSGLSVELDIFDAPFAPLIIAEVEFPDIESAHKFKPLDWFGTEVTLDAEYHNSNLSRKVFGQK